MRVPVRGGPFDGTFVRKGPFYGWLSARGAAVRVSEESGPGRVLYRLQDDVYEFEDNRTAVCEGCQVYRTRPISVGGLPDPCQLCGFDPNTSAV